MTSFTVSTHSLFVLPQGLLTASSSVFLLIFSLSLHLPFTVQTSQCGVFTLSPKHLTWTVSLIMEPTAALQSVLNREQSVAVAVWSEWTFPYWKKANDNVAVFHHCWHTLDKDELRIVKQCLLQGSPLSRTSIREMNFMYSPPNAAFGTSA